MTASENDALRLNVDAERYFEKVLALKKESAEFKRKKTIPWKILLQAYKDLPHEIGGGDHLRRILRLLEELKKAKKIAFFKLSTSGKWDRSRRPPRPLFVKDLTVLKKSLPTPYNWHPKLADFAEKNRNKSELKKIDHFLKEFSQKIETPLISLNERSFEIFGKEKTLRNLLFSGGLQDHLKPLDLGCRYYPPPLVYQYFPEVKLSVDRVLVIENKDTFYSMIEWNRLKKYYTHICYGNGNAFSQSHSRLEEILRDSYQAVFSYFGDLDINGIQTLITVHQTHKNQNLPIIVPALSLYQQMLDRANGLPLQKDKNTYSETTQLLQDSKDLFPEQFLEQIQRTLFLKNKRIPQEILSLTWLLDNYKGENGSPSFEI